MYFLWLDDWRNPEYYAPEFNGETIWVKNYQEFEKAVQERGMPAKVSFDYDLDDWNYNGMSCAKVILRKCITENLKFPEYNIHSEHPDAHKLKSYLEMEIDRREL